MVPHKAKLLGIEIRKLRQERGLSLARVANDVKVDRSHLNKVELGEYMPSAKVLADILSYFSLPESKIKSLLEIAGINRGLNVWSAPEKKEGNMEQKPMALPSKNGINVSVDPVKTPVLYTDSALVHTNDNGLVIDFAQSLGGSPNHTVVTRVGMSFEHARRLIQAVAENIEKNER